MRGDRNIGVVDQEEFIVCVRDKLRQCADFAVGTEARGTLDEADGTLGEFSLELLNGGDGRVVD